MFKIINFRSCELTGTKSAFVPTIFEVWFGSKFEV